MKILLTGANGQLGSCFQDRAKDHEVFATDYQELDIVDAEKVNEYIKDNQPDLIVNAAAYTAVDKAETEKELAHNINAVGSKNLANAASEMNIPLIHVSTDYVFDGSATSPYDPSAKVSPLGVYGETKWAGEEFVRSSLEKHLIIRTAWVFSEYGNNFVKTMLRLGKERDELSIVSDQVGCPTYAGDLADVILSFISKIEIQSELPWGTHHFNGANQTSWCGFAEKIFEYVETDLGIKSPKVIPIPSSAYPTPAERPKFSVMDTSSLKDWIVNDSWEKSLKTVLAKL